MSTAVAAKKKLEPSAYQVAIICARTEHIAMAQLMLEEEHSKHTVGDYNQVFAGTVGGINVVIGWLPAGRTSETEASITVTDITYKFKALKGLIFFTNFECLPTSPYSMRLADVIVAYGAGVSNTPTAVSCAFWKKGVEQLAATDIAGLAFAVPSRLMDTFSYPTPTSAESKEASSARPDYRQAGNDRKVCDGPADRKRPAPVVHFASIETGTYYTQTSKPLSQATVSALGTKTAIDAHGLGAGHESRTRLPCIYVGGICGYGDGIYTDAERYRLAAAATAASVMRVLLTLTKSRGPAEAGSTADWKYPTAVAESKGDSKAVDEARTAASAAVRKAEQEVLLARRKAEHEVRKAERQRRIKTLIATLEELRDKLRKTEQELSTEQDTLMEEEKKQII